MKSLNWKKKVDDISIDEKFIGYEAFTFRVRELNEKINWR